MSNSGEEQDARLLQDNPAFIEQNGRIVMQVESVPLVAPWVFESSRPGFTGNGYYRMTGNTVQSGPPNGRLIFNLQINNPGTVRSKVMRSTLNVTHFPFLRSLSHSFRSTNSTFIRTRIIPLTRKYPVERCRIRCDPCTSTNSVVPFRTWSNDCFVKLVGAAGERGQDVKVFQSGSSFTWRWSTRYEVSVCVLSAAGLLRCSLISRSAVSLSYSSSEPWIHTNRTPK